LIAAFLALLIAVMAVPAAAQPRARDLGVPFTGTPGASNAITDVPGVEVGLTTLVSGEAPAGGGAAAGAGPVRTGVTAVLPRGRERREPVFAGWFSLNGNGEMTGTAWVEESGLLEGPIFITNTHSVGVVRDAAIKWAVRGATAQPWALPVVAETWDGRLNDINGFHVKDEDVFAALENARAGAVPEGNVGGGTGMVCYGFKCGTGTSSRVVALDDKRYIVGVLVQANHGRMPELMIAGVPVGAELAAARTPAGADQDPEQGSIIIVVGTDAPLAPHQVKRLARRAALGLARSGSTSGNGSGDLFIAFSTANAAAAAATTGTPQLAIVPNDQMNPLFEATVQAVDEAIVNALVAARTMTGLGGRTIEALPHDRLTAILKKYGRRQ
jgi:L-aminopeptidase/D-esterase-like protein